MAQRSFNVLFLCTGNSARSILGEAIMNHWGQGRFIAYSAGSQPQGAVHPLALDILSVSKIPVEHQRYKSWDEFATPQAPAMGFIFTVCDDAAGESCPIWPGRPMTAHWGMADPAAAIGSEVQRRLAFRQTFAGLENRIRAFTSLPFASLDALSLQARLDAIGQTTTGSAA